MTKKFNIGGRNVVAQHGVSARDAETPRKMAGLTVEDFTERLLKKMRELQGSLLDEIDRRMGEIPAASLAISYGFISDKIAAVETPHSITQLTQNNFSMNGMSRSEALALLCGQASS